MIDPRILEAKSDQMNAVDFVKPQVFRICKVDYFPDRPQQNVHLHLEGYDGRPYKPCKSMLRGLCKAWGMDEQAWNKRLIELYCEPSVMWAGKEAGGIRINAISHIDKPFELVVQLNRKQREIQTWNVIPDNAPVVKEFVASHYIQDINEAQSNQDISNIVKTVFDAHGADARDQLKEAVVAARAKFAEPEQAQ